MRLGIPRIVAEPIDPAVRKRTRDEDLRLPWYGKKSRLRALRAEQHDGLAGELDIGGDHLRQHLLPFAAEMPIGVVEEAEALLQLDHFGRPAP